MFDHLVIQFAKLPKLGKVKTRLTPHLGEQACLNLHRHLLQHTYEHALVSVQRMSGISILSLDQFGEDEQIQSIAKATAITIQQGSDLGERMANAIHWGLAFAKKVLIVGSDCPGLTQDYYARALEALDEQEHVFINAEDGGYVLVGTTTPCDEFFMDIPWGTEDVMQVTLQRLQETNNKAIILGPLWDVDRIEDYERLLKIMPNMANEFS